MARIVVAGNARHTIDLNRFVRWAVPSACLLIMVGCVAVISPIPVAAQVVLVNAAFFGAIAAALAALVHGIRSSSGRARLAWSIVLASMAVQAVLAALYVEAGPTAEGASLSPALLFGPFSALASIWVLQLLIGPIKAQFECSLVGADALWLAAATLAVSWPVVVFASADAGTSGLTSAILIAHAVTVSLLIGSSASLLLHTRPGSRRYAATVTVGLIGWQLLQMVYEVAWINGGISDDQAATMLYTPPLLAVLWTTSQGPHIAGLIRGRNVSTRDRMFVTWIPVVVIAGIIIASRERPSGEWRVVIGVAVFSLLVRLTIELRQSEQLALRLRERSAIDPLTGLVSRAQFEHQMQSRKAASTAMMIDLDRFKQVNDQLGHPVGDALLGQVAERMTDELDDRWHLTRIGGDEFLAVADARLTPHEAEAAARGVIEALAAPFAVESRRIWMGASVGVAIRPRRGDIDSLLALADMALRDAKRAGRDEIVVAADESTSRLREMSELGAAIPRAIERGEFVVLFQPQVDLCTGHILGLEALVRWDHPTRGRLTPNRFLHIAEATGRIGEIDEFVTSTALRAVVEWNERFDRELRLAVNMSAWQLAHEDVGQGVQTLLDRHAPELDPGLVVIELPETLLVDAPEVTQRRLTELRSTGVGISVDDFGAGFTSIAHLRQFPIEEVKLDRHLVAEAANGGVDESVAAAVVALADSLGLQVLAEGIETPDQWDAMRTLGCKTGQGYLFARPLSVDDFASLLAGDRALGPAE